MSIPALIPVALTGLQRTRQKKKGRRKDERESWTVLLGELANNMAAASEDE